MAKSFNVRNHSRTQRPLRSQTRSPRQRMIEAFNRNVQYLAAKEAVKPLDSIALDVFGHQLNSEWGASEIANALVGLAPLATPQLLENAVYESIVARLRCTNSDESAVDAMAQVEAERLGVKFAPCGCLAGWEGVGVRCCDNVLVTADKIQRWADVGAPNGTPLSAYATAAVTPIDTLPTQPAKPVTTDAAEIAALYAQLDADSQVHVARILKALAATCTHAA